MHRSMQHPAAASAITHGRLSVGRGSIRCTCKINAGRRRPISAAHTRLSPVPPPFRRHSGSMGDEEGGLQAFRKSADSKVYFVDCCGHLPQSKVLLLHAIVCTTAHGCAKNSAILMLPVSRSGQ